VVMGCDHGDIGVWGKKADVGHVRVSGEQRARTMSAPNAPAAASSGAAASSDKEEEVLRREIRSLYGRLKKREPIETTYKRLLFHSGLTTKTAALPTKDKFYARVHGNLRTTVEDFMTVTEGKDPFDKISTSSGQRPVFPDVATMQKVAAFSLREGKVYEQRALLDATLTALPRRHGMDEMSRRLYLESVARGLQQKPKSSVPSRSKSPLAAAPVSAAERADQARQQAEKERQQAMARAREEARTKRELQERAQREAEVERQRAERESESSPNQALGKVIRSMFQKLWDMEFAHLGNINPFRMVIDRETCASIGAPDYMDIVKTPMNLTYIQQKMERSEYDSLSAFSDDVELMLSNAILYNSHSEDPYHVAAEEMKRKYNKMKKKVIQTFQQKS
jgi:Bromodomain